MPNWHKKWKTEKTNISFITSRNDRGFATIYGISAYHGLSSIPAHSDVYLIQHYVIKFVKDLRQARLFYQGTLVSFTITKVRHH